MTLLSNWLDKNGFDAFLQHGLSEDADLYYLSKFKTSDPIELVSTSTGTHIFTSKMEVSRAEKESRADKVHRGTFEDVKEFLEEHGFSNIAVPKSYPSGLLEQLEKGFEVKIVESPVEELRLVKNSGELEKLKSAQKTTEEAMEHVKHIIEESEVREGNLHWENKVLTSERLRQEIQVFLLENGCQNILEPITASGKESADPHVLGEGPIKVNEPVVVDIFPRKDRYYGDMTRTFLKGENPEAKKMHEAVEDAQDAALNRVKAGVKASEVHKAAAEMLEKHGFETSDDEGFVHSTGHGVGLDLHESPRISEDSDHLLQAGEVITVEPGLYYNDVGGVRLENMAVVTEDGYESFNTMERELELE